MGRWSTGAWTTSECKKINLSYLLKNGFVKKGCEIYSIMSWTSGCKISILSNLTEGNNYIRLLYTTTFKSGETKQFDYKVYLDSVPSNIGKGEVLYFRCPVSGKRCRVLYKAYGCEVWKCREAYANRIYYPLQLSSKRNIYNDRYWALDRQIEVLKEMRGTSTYRGKPTKRSLRLHGLRNQRDRMDELRWSLDAMPKYIQRILTRQGQVFT